ncbi:MAG: SpoIIE family protein phosphatase [bacterium]|nr:SpoIIE family protein phosphatase [bacterium]
MRQYRACYFILNIFILLMMSCSSGFSGKNPPVAKNGVIDLTGWDFEKDGVLTLDGEWIYYKNQFIDPEKIIAGEDLPGTKEITVVPELRESFFDSMIPSKIEHRFEEYGTYFLKIKGLKNPPQKDLSFSFDYVLVAYSLYFIPQFNNSDLNNKEDLSSPTSISGIISSDKEGEIPQYYPAIERIKRVGDENYIVLHLSNFQMPYGGMVTSLEIDLENAMRNKWDKERALLYLTMGVVLIMAFYHLGLFIERKEDKASLLFSIFCLLISARFLVSVDYLSQFYPEPSLFLYALAAKIDYWTFYLGLPVFYTFMYKVYKKEFSSIVNRLTWIISIPYSIIVLIFPLPYYSFLLPFYQIFCLIIGVYILWCLIKAVVKKRVASFYSFLGSVFLFVTVINDILYAADVIYSIYMTLYGLIGFILFQSFILSKMFAKAHEKAQNLNRELQKLDLLKDEFLANTSHELRTPLNGIIGITESLIDGATGELSVETNKNLYMISSSGRRLASLVNDVLDFSKLKNQDLVLKLRSVDLRQLVEIVLTLSKPLLVDKAVELNNEIPETIPYVLADEERLQQIFHNLVGNAIKFTASGTISISAEVIPGTDKNKYVEVGVSDTGIGIPEDKYDDIFKSFEQLDSSASREYGGTGLGLSITRQLVELHGGSIRLDSEVGTGSTFNFTLPVAQGDANVLPIDPGRLSAFKELSSLQYNATGAGIIAGAGQYEESQAAMDDSSKKLMGANLNKFKILAVDDEPVNLQVIRNNLHLAGAEVITAPSGREALEKLDLFSPDIVLLDVMMPKMNGFETAKLIREKFSREDLPIIFLTAKNQVNDLVDGFSVGGNDYIIKPFSKSELFARIVFHATFQLAVKESKRLISIEHNLEVARKIQLSTIPENLPTLPGLDIAAEYIPMEMVAGDFYDFNVLEDDCVGVLISDVSGHGIPAALIASMIKIVFYMQADIAGNPEKFLNNMNRILTGNIEQQFITAAFVHIDIKSKKLLYANAGHMPLLIFNRKNNKLDIYNPRGKPIGILDEIDLIPQEIDIKSGDRILLYTDGVTETFNENKEMFGDKGFHQAIYGSGDLSAAEFTSRLTTLLKEWRGTGKAFDDDVTFVIIDIE